jgi:hypothetical protein
MIDQGMKAWAEYKSKFGNGNRKFQLNNKNKYANLGKSYEDAEAENTHMTAFLG